MPDLSDNQRQAVTGLGCGVALIALLGSGLVGYFALRGLPWPLLATIAVALLVGIESLRSAILKVLEGSGGGGGEAKGGPAPGSRSRRGIPSGWPPEPDP